MAGAYFEIIISIVCFFFGYFYCLSSKYIKNQISIFGLHRLSNITTFIFSLLKACFKRPKLVILLKKLNQVIIVKMQEIQGVQEIISRSCQASILAYRKVYENNPTLVNGWRALGARKIVLKVKTESQLYFLSVFIRNKRNSVKERISGKIPFAIFENVLAIGPCKLY